MSREKSRPDSSFGPNAPDRKLGYPETRMRAAELTALSELDPLRCTRILERLPLTTSPVNLLVPRALRRKKVPGANLHSLSVEPPRKSILEITDNVSIVSPELCFLQMASSLEFEELVLLGCELCGYYALQSPPDGMIPSLPLTSKNRLEAFIAKARGAHGVETARKAASFVIDDSASPMETAAYVLLCLPQSLGGYGLPTPVPNKTINLTRATMRTFGSPFYVGDLVWPERKVIMEYDGVDNHAGYEQIARDARRRDALTAEGFSVFVITKKQLYSSSEFFGISRAAAKKLGVRLRCRGKGFDARNARLRKKIL